jgi:hypothetical protein
MLPAASVHTTSEGTAVEGVDGTVVAGAAGALVLLPKEVSRGVGTSAPQLSATSLPVFGSRL